MKKPCMYQNRSYQSRIRVGRLESFRVRVKETDLHVQANRLLREQTLESVLRHRGYVEALIHQYPEFATTLTPWVRKDPMPRVIADMMSAAVAAGVGPMAAVAGAIAQGVAYDLLPLSEEIIVENGGDIFICSADPVTVAVFAGNSPFSMKMGVELEPMGRPVCVCTSSGTVGHSLSFGNADAVSVVAEDCALADAAATAIANRVRKEKDIDAAIESGSKIPGVKGIVIIKSKAAGFWGEIRLTPIG